MISIPGRSVVLPISVLMIVVIKGVQNAALQSLGVKNALNGVPGLGNRPLKIKAYPAIENYQSDLYEVYAEPYTYDLRAQAAIVVLQGEAENDSGDLRQGCEKIGQHFNPYLLQHGAPFDPFRHVGDLGNVVAGEDGTAEVNYVDPLVSLSGGPRGVVGRTLVVTMDPDDLGRGGTADSLTNGQSGKPVACGVIAFIR
ncbi:hypothetical protein JTB14_007725 [Gonioctena quinquepunctata]|nr:hypothetical protein JTB14_007725 [Gonioctena quinquepunctata]